MIHRNELMHSSWYVAWIVCSRLEEKAKNQAIVYAHNKRESGSTFGIQGSGSRILQGFLFIV